MILLQVFIAFMLPASVIGYLVALLKLISTVRKEEGEYWESIGNPSLSDPKGQFVILKKLFFSEDLPQSVVSERRSLLLSVKILFTTSIVCFVVLTIMVLGGYF